MAQTSQTSARPNKCNVMHMRSAQRISVWSSRPHKGPNKRDGNWRNVFIDLSQGPRKAWLQERGPLTMGGIRSYPLPANDVHGWNPGPFKIWLDLRNPRVSWSPEFRSCLATRRVRVFWPAHLLQALELRPDKANKQNFGESKETQKGKHAKAKGTKENNGKPAINHKCKEVREVWQ